MTEMEGKGRIRGWKDKRERRVGGTAKGSKVQRVERLKTHGGSVDGMMEGRK